MSGIQFRGGGLPPPKLTTEGKQDGQGNGNGGMFFGGQQQEEQHAASHKWHWDRSDELMNAMPTYHPLFGSLTRSLKTINTAAATLLYQKKDPH